MRRPSYELILSLVAILAITAWYGYVARSGVPHPGGPVGHTLGIVGFLLMLCAETLYTLRKRLRRFTMGSMNAWLQVHIVTGIVGPYLVLLHSAWRFNGLAGVVAILTAAMVISGFVGRYIYTAVPRTLDGVEVGVQELEQRIAAADRQLQALGIDLGATGLLAFATAAPQRGWTIVLGRPLVRWRQQRRMRRAVRKLNVAGRAQESELEQLLADRSRLLLQVNSLAVTRQLLALWHLFHIPLGAVLFTLAFVHVGAALYYFTFLK